MLKEADIVLELMQGPSLAKHHQVCSYAPLHIPFMLSSADTAQSECSGMLS